MNETRLNAYHVMWLFVFFDLPTGTKSERHNASLFRKGLEKDGFTMMQYSVYTRHCGSKESMKAHVGRVKKLIPATGHINVLGVTDKQFSEMHNFWGKIEKTKPEAVQQLELF